MKLTQKVQITNFLDSSDAANKVGRSQDYPIEYIGKTGTLWAINNHNTVINVLLDDGTDVVLHISEVSQF